MDWISSLLLATVRLAIPVLLISLAELYGQRAGMVNIGLEGLASIGALVGFLVCYVTGSNWLGLLCGALAGVIVNMIYAFSTVTLCADHTVYGMAVNIFAPALASFIYRVYFGTGSDLKQITTMSSVAIPGLKDIPVLGPLLFDQSPMVYLTFLLVLFTAIFFGKTRAGLSYKAVGEHPQAAATLGIPVVGVKYLACVICGALSGIGGAYLTTCYSSTYTDGIVAGRGFIALAAVIFGRWNAGGILLACLFFGFCDALQIRLIQAGERDIFDDAVRLDVAEHRNFAEDGRLQRLVAAEDDDVRPDAHALQLFDGMLRRLGFVLVGATQKRHQSDMDEEAVLLPDLEGDLPHGLEERLRFDVTDGAANFCDDDVRIGLLADTEIS